MSISSNLSDGRKSQKSSGLDNCSLELVDETLPSEKSQPNCGLQCDEGANSSHRKMSSESTKPLISSKQTGWKGMSSLEKSLSLALGIVSVLAIGLMIAVIVVGIKLNKDDYKATPKPISSTAYPPWITTIKTTTLSDEVTTRERPTTTEGTPTSSWLGNNSCETQQCIDVSLWVNIAADPCSEFYEYACGGWELRSSEWDQSKVTNQFSKLEESINVKIRDILEQNVTDTIEENAYISLAKTFYQGCLESTDADLKQDIRQYLNAKFSNFDYHRGSNLVELLAALQLDLGENYLFSMSVNTHLELKNSTAIYFRQPELSKWLLEESGELAYQQLIQQTWLEVFANSSKVVENIAASIIGFEKNLTQIMEWNDASLFNSTSSLFRADGYSSYTIINENSKEDFEMQTWKALQNLVLQQLSYDCQKLNGTQCENETQPNSIIVDVNYYRSIDRLLSSTNPEIIAFYLKWHVILDLFTYTTSTYKHLNGSDEMFDNGTPFSNSSEPYMRSELCLKETRTIFDPAFTSNYMRSITDDPYSLKEMMRNVSEELRNTLVKMTHELPWVATTETRALVAQKLADVQVLPLLPSSLMENESYALENHYMEFEISRTLFSPVFSMLQNILEYRRWSFANRIKSLYKGPDSLISYEETKMQLHVKPYLERLQNVIYIPSGILESSIFRNENYSTPMAQWYGSLGTLLAELFLDVFAHSSLAYNEGNPQNSWDAETLQQLESLLECIMNEFSQYNFTTLNDTINLQTTTKSDIISIGSLRIALLTYILQNDSKSENATEMGYEFSEDQLFFLGFSQNWCSTTIPVENTEKLIEIDSHYVNKYKMQAILESVEAFRDVWGCSLGPNQEMCPSIWS